MFEIDAIYDNLRNADIIGLKAALGSIKSVRGITVNKDTSTVTLLSDKRKIREDLLKNAGELNNCSFRVIADRRRT